MRGAVTLIRRATIPYLVLALAPVGAAGADSITIAKGGEPAVSIVVPAEADEAVQRAANELQEYVAKLVGVELPIVSDEAELDGPAIFVGPCRQVREADLPPEDANLEACAIRVRDGNLILVGRDWWGTEFAVYWFLEEDLGIRWFVPGPLGEYVPKHEPGELTVEVEPRVVEPDFSPRIWSDWTGDFLFPDWKRWRHHSKVSLYRNPRGWRREPCPLPWSKFQNNIFQVFPVEKYAEAHPEYYPLVDGERWIPTGGRWRPCESNPAVMELTLEYARQRFDTHPEETGFSVGMDDINVLCQCPNCIALDADPQAHKRGEYSDRHYWFVNTLARELAKIHPGKYIGTLIYSIARKPPTKIDTLEPNVFGYITQCEAEWWREGLREEDMALTREWRRRCQHLCRYTYWGLGWVTPRYFPHYTAEALKFDQDLGFHGQYVEVYTNWPNTGPMIWAGTKLLWDASLDIDELLDEFFEKMFIEAAPHMKAYYDFLEQTWMGGHPGRVGWGSRDVGVQACSMTVEQLEECERLLASALARATTPIVKERILMVERGLRYGGYLVREHDISEGLRACQVTDEASAAEALAKVVQLQDVITERKQYWEELLEGNDLAAQTFQALNREPVGAQQLEVELGSSLARVVAWYRQNASGRLGEVVRSLKPAGGDEVSALLDAWSYMERGNPPNLLQNPGFEQTGENEQQPEMDWSTTGPPGWHTWSSTDQARFEATDQAREGRLAAGISNAASGAYLQMLPVNPGERYLCQTWAKRQPGDSTGVVMMGVRWKTPKRAWHKVRRGYDYVLELQPGAEGWQPLILCVDVPEGAGYLVFQCVTREQDEGTVVLFDDCGAYRIPTQPQ